MLYLLLAIFSSAMVSIVMRLSERKVTHNLGMLVMNYLMCSLLSASSTGHRQLRHPPTRSLPSFIHSLIHSTTCSLIAPSFIYSLV